MKSFRRIIPAVVLLIAFALGVLPTYAASNSLHYGKGSSSDIALKGDELFARLFPEQTALPAEERNYLASIDDFSFFYNDNIDSNLVESEYDGEKGTLTVTASVDSYTAVNGTVVSWIPQTVSLSGGAEKQFVYGNGKYRVVFENLWHSGMYLLDVRYSWEPEVGSAIADRMLTACYDTAENTLQTILSWESYLADKAAYNSWYQSWCEYNEKKQAYDAYLVRLQEYHDKKTAYETYCAARDAYNALVEEYLASETERAAYHAQVTAWYAYQTALTEFSTLDEEYRQYLFYISEMERRVNILESMFPKDSHGWSFYRGVMGNAVNTVLDRRDELKKAVNVKYLNGAKNATEALRPILEEYYQLRRVKYKTKLEKLTALYSFYAENYTALQQNLAALYENIVTIFVNANVQLKLDTEATDEQRAKLPHLKQFIAQLYMLSACLDDSEVLDPDKHLDPQWEKKQRDLIGTVNELIEDVVRVEDAVSSPDGVIVPTEEVLPPEDPVPVEEPDWNKTFPEDPREKTLPPEPVANPGTAPAKVDEPGTEPPAVTDPGERTEPAIDPLCRALAEKLRAGTLVKRAAQGKSKTLTFSKTVSCNRSFENLKTVTFYDRNGAVLQLESLEYDSSVTPPTVNGYETEKATYTFLGWVPDGSADQNTVDFSTLKIEKHYIFRPLYRETLKTYPVTWIINGNTYTTNYTYGETPECPASTERSSDANDYEFTGWEPMIRPVSGPATYTAQYTATPRKFRVTWKIGSQSVIHRYQYNDIPSYGGSTERETDNCQYVFLGWEPAIEAVTQDAVYTAKYRVVPLCRDRSGKTCEIVYTDEAMVVIVPKDAVNFENALSYAKSIGKPLKIRFSTVDVDLDLETLDALKQAGAVGMACVDLQTDEEIAAAFRIVFQNASGKDLELEKELRMSLRYTAVNVVVYQLTGEEREAVANERNTFLGKTNADYLCYPQYSLSYTGENCDLNSMTSRAYAGQEIKLDGNCAFGYEIVGAVLTLENGETQTVGTSFIMPAGQVAISLQIEKIIYHVTFVSEGAVVCEADYGFNEEVIPPEDPTKSEDENNRYAFAGWTPYVTRTVGEDRNPVYTAVFSASPREFVQPTGGGIDDFFHAQIFWYLVGAVVILLAASIVAVVLIRKKIRVRKTSGTKPEKEPESPAEGSDESGSKEI